MAQDSITPPKKEILLPAQIACAGKRLLFAMGLTLVGLMVPPSVRAMEPADIYERWGGAVVTIKTVGGDRQGTGSGFIIPPHGQVVTNYHVIQGASTITVVLNTGETRAAQAVLQRDPDLDLAILQIDPTNLKRVILGDSNRVRPGERVVAIGSPLGLSETVSVGNVGQIRTRNGVALIQITAPLSPGNSGGPLFNEQGEVIGVNFLKLTRGENLNFAVAINELRALLGQPVPRSTQHTLHIPIERELSVPPSRKQAKRYEIHLWGGAVASAESYRESGDMIIYERGGGSVTLSRSSVSRIVALETGSVQEITRTPPPQPEASPREKRVDVQEILSKPQTPPVPDRATAPPIPPAIPPGTHEECFQDPEVFSGRTIGFRAVTFNVIEFSVDEKRFLVEVRELPPKVSLSESATRMLVEDVLRSGKRISLVHRQSVGDRTLASVCVNDKNIAKDPRLTPYALKGQMVP